MERLTVNKSKDDMSMVELAHNCCFAKDGKAMYQDYDTIIDARAFVRNLIRARNLISSDDEVFTNDTAFDEFMTKCLVIDPFNDIGLIALFYRNLWVQADLYERLKYYENLQEQGRLLELPCSVGDTVWYLAEQYSGKTIAKPVTVSCFQFDRFLRVYCIEERQNTQMFYPDDFRKTVFLSKEEAEKALEGKTE